MTWEQRWHPLRREWVIVSAHRNHRPWRGEVVDDSSGAAPAFQPDCYLCPGNTRVSGLKNPAYRGVYVFDNDHPCVAPTAPEPEPSTEPLFRASRAVGLSRVICYTPRHDLSLAELSQDDVVALLDVLGEQYRELGEKPEVNHVLMFENRGEVVGVSNPHPHCQVYATSFVFRTIEIEAEAAAEHHAAHGSTLLGDIVAAEERDGRRIVVAGERSVAFVPYFARYPYETFVVPRVPRASVADLTPAERSDFAATLGETLARMDNLWSTPFPYVMVLHQAPTDGRPHPGFHFHVQLHPPLRKPGLLKYLAGPEIGGGNFLNDTAPEATAAELRATSAMHYRRA